MILRYEQGHNPETHRWFGYQRSTFLDSQMLDDTKPLKYLLVKVRGSQLARLAEADFLATGRINLPTTNMQFTSSKTHRPKVHPSRKGLSLTMFDLWVPVWFLLHSPDASSLGWPPWSDKLLEFVLPTSGPGRHRNDCHQNRWDSSGRQAWPGMGHGLWPCLKTWIGFVFVERFPRVSRMWIPKISIHNLS